MAEENRVRSSGFVTRFNAQKGYGFIQLHGDNKTELFVHQSAVNSDGFRTLYPNEEVEFDIVLGDDGRMKASDVTLPGGGAFDPRSRWGNSRRVRRSNGNGGGGGAVVNCYNCGGVGHRRRDCSSPPLQPPRLGNGGGREQGQIARVVVRACHNCGEEGHLVRDCQRDFPRGDERKTQETRKCFNCGRTGHISLDCKQKA